MLARGILGSRRTDSVSSQPFPNSSGWWWLISSVFLIRISCHKTTHANGYYRPWPGWAVSISVLPLTRICLILNGASWFIGSIFLLLEVYKLMVHLRFIENWYLLSNFFLFCKVLTKIIKIKLFSDSLLGLLSNLEKPQFYDLWNDIL